MLQLASLRDTGRSACLLLLVSLLAIAGASEARAQCLVTSGPAVFDSLASTGLPSHLRTTNDSMGIAGSTRRLAVRYNYGYVIYSVSAPGSPVRTSYEDLYVQDGYPKSGDGQTRTGKLGFSSDGMRALLPWTDVAGYGTIAQAYSGTSFAQGGDYFPPGNDTRYTAVAKVGSRYLGFTTSSYGLYAADVTNLPGSGPSVKNGIPSESMTSLGTDLSGLASVEAPARTWIVSWSLSRVVAIDVSNPGTSVPGLTSGFTWRAYTAAELGVPSGAYINTVATTAHPVDGSLHLLVEGYRSSGGARVSTGVHLLRADPDTGALTTVGSFTLPSGENTAQLQTVLLPFETDVVAFLFHKTAAGLQKLQVRSSLDFTKNLADTISPIPEPAAVKAMVGFRSTGGAAHLYFADGYTAYAYSLNCATAPGPATAQLAVDRIPAVGSATSVPDGGSVFIGDQLRIKPSFSPPDTVTPLIDWRLDYDFHDGNAADSQATAMRLLNADASRTLGPVLPLAEYTLVGPCDPAQLPQAGSAPNPATGDGCWTSVTTNGPFGIPVGTPDFSPDTPPVEKQLKIGFEVQNALNQGGSSVAAHRITWKVPQQLLKSSSILSGGTLEDGSEGSPVTTGFRWYFSQVPVGEAGEDLLALEAACTGPTCAPSFVQAGQASPGLQRPGDYRYWVSVPYRGGFQTAECPGLVGETCTGDATKTLKVTDVVLSLTSPSQVLTGQPTFNVTSTSKQAGSVQPCPAAPGFTYDFCPLSGGDCPEGDYVSTLLIASNPFPTTGTGTITIPTPSVGTWGLRIRYSYTTGAGCASPTVAQWPADGGWAPLTVLQAVPSIRLRNSSDTADLPKSLGYYWELLVGQTARVYAELDGVRDATPPAGLAWSYRVAGKSQETPIGTTQGASFSVAAVGDYQLILRGYGNDVVASFGVATSGGGSSTGPPTVSSVTASNYSPSVGQSVSFSCNATAGGAPITSYDWVLDTGVTRTTSTKTTSYAYSTLGTKMFSCTANDSAGASSATRTNSLTVGGGGQTGSCVFEIKNEAGAKISYDPVFKLYEAASGQPLTFQATGTTGTVSWSFGNGATGSGNPANYTYTNTGSSPRQYTVSLSATGCAATASISIAPGSGLDYSVADATTGAPVAKSGTTFEATAGQRLKFTATGATGAVSWSFGDGTPAVTDTAPEKTYAPLVDTPYTVTLTNGTATKSYTVAVKGSTGAPLTGGFTFRYADGTTVNRSAVQPNKAITFTAADQATTYTWDFGDGSPLGQGSPKEHTFTAGGAFPVKVTVARTGVPGAVVTPVPLVFTVLTPPDPLLWVAGGMAYSDGQSGERWQSDLSIHNPGTQSATVSLAFVAGSGWEGVTNVDWRTLGVGPGETRAFPNVLAGFFGAAKGSWGVVLVRGDSVPVPPVIVGRTYNAATAEETGTFGLSVPAMSVSAGVKPQSAAGGNYLAGLRHDATFRTNLTIANLKDETAEVEVVFRAEDGSVLGSPAKITVEARGVKQLNAALSAPPATGEEPIGGAGWPTPVPHFSAEVKLKQGTGVYPYATVIDQGTGDSIVVTPAARPSGTYRLPGIVRVKGKNGAYWVSDVAILNPTPSPRRIRVTYSYVKTGTTLRIDAAQTISLAPYQLAVGIDFVRLWLGLEEDDPAGYASSYVDVAPAPDDPAPTEPLVVAGKTYTPSGRGSVGLQVDPFVLEDGIGEQSSRRRIVLSGLESNSRYRTNVALFLTPGSTGSAQVDVRVLDSFGRESKVITHVGLDASNPFVQFNSADLFGGFNTDDTSRATVVIDSPHGTSYVGAYATVIDNTSEDATFVAGQPAP